MHFDTIDTARRTASFSTTPGITETYLCIDSEGEGPGHPRRGAGGAGVQRDMENLHVRLRSTLEHLGLSEDHLVFSRLFLRDVRGARKQQSDSPLFASLSQGVLSVVEQPPLNGGWASLLAYLVQGPDGRALERTPLPTPSKPECAGFSFPGNHYEMIWAANVDGSGSSGSGTGNQTRKMLESLNGILASRGMSLVRDVVRTWVFVDEIDTRYQAMVKERKKFFEQHGLTPDTGYPASTGIEGKGWTAESLVSLDALAISGLAPGQIVRMEALSHMPPTISYGVTFERGLRLRFGDRSHLYVSGTASIDRRGNVVHQGDVITQTGRTIENMSALLTSHGATLSDLAYIILYLRNAGDYPAVREYLSTALPPLVPVVALRASVCRPAWLVEMEGVAIIGDAAPFPPLL